MSRNTPRPLPPPQDRPHIKRRATRILVIDDRDRLLLFEDRDLGLDPTPTWWMTPGGGVDAGESDEAAALRELREETGLSVTADALIGPIAVRTVTHGYSDIVTEQDEVVYAVRTPAFVVDTSLHTPEELLTMTRHHWWTREELKATTETVWPDGILTLWERVDADPGAAPLDLGHVEESTVPA